jgi:glucan 1,4-alpha-glucosidase
MPGHPDGGNPPEHLTIVPFTRMLAGPIDYTPGIFDIKFDKYKKKIRLTQHLHISLRCMLLFIVHFKWLQIFRKTIMHIQRFNL